MFCTNKEKENDLFLLTRICFCNFFFLRPKSNFSLQLISSIAYNVKVSIKNHAIKFGSDPTGIKLCLIHRFKSNSDLKAMTRQNINPKRHVKLLNCQATFCTEKQSHIRQMIANAPQPMFKNI